MKILSMYLKNFIGVYDGTGGLNEIEIDFSNTEKTIFLLSGSNGSGKTTVLSHLQPFAGNNDPRPYTVLKGEEGVKWLLIKDYDDLYEIEHRYYPNKDEDGHKVKSFIKKNGNELNDNGGVRSFKALVKEHLDLDEEFFKIGRMGSNVSNFINLSSQDRKRFITAFLPNTAPYVERNKAARVKVTEYNKLFKFLSDEVTKLGDVPTLVNEKTTLDSQINSTNLSIKAVEKEMNEIQYAIKEAIRTGTITSIDEVIYDPSKSKIAKLSNDLNINIESLNKNEADITEEELLTKELELLKSSASDIKELTSVNNSELRNLYSNISNKKEILEKPKEQELKRKSLLKTLEDLNNEKESIESNIIEEKNIYLEVEKGSRTSLERIADLIKEEIGRISRLYLGLTAVKLEDTSHLLGVQSYKDLIKAKNSEIEKLRIDSASLSKIKKELTALDKNCSNEDCPYEALLDDNTDYNVLISNLQEEVKTLKESLSEAEILNQNNVEYEDIITTLKSIDTSCFKFVKELNPEFKPILDLIENKNFTEELLSSLRKNTGRIIPKVKLIWDIHEQVNKLAKVKETILSSKETLKALSSSDDIIEQVTKELVVLEDDLKDKLVEQENLTSKKNIVNEKTLKVINNLSLINAKKTLLESIDSLKNEITILKNQDSLHNEKVAELILKKDRWEKLAEEKDGLGYDLRSIEELSIAKNVAIQRCKEYIEKKAQMVSKMELVENIKKATDVTTGIPLYLIKESLHAIKATANSLLDIVYDGAFQIEDFVVTVRKF